MTDKERSKVALKAADYRTLRLDELYHAILSLDPQLMEQLRADLRELASGLGRRDLDEVRVLLHHLPQLHFVSNESGGVKLQIQCADALHLALQRRDQEQDTP